MFYLFSVFYLYTVNLQHAIFLIKITLVLFLSIVTFNIFFVYSASNLFSIILFNVFFDYVLKIVFFAFIPFAVHLQFKFIMRFLNARNITIYDLMIELFVCVSYRILVVNLCFFEFYRFVLNYHSFFRLNSLY